MTPEEHATLALKMRVIAQQNLLDWLADVLCAQYKTLPSKERSEAILRIAIELSRTRAEHSKVTLPDLHPTDSDMRTALFLEPFDELSTAILRRIDGSDQLKP